DPLIPDDPKRAISDNYEVRGSTRAIERKFITTRVCFAHGMDLFLTRVSPSGTFDVLSESFNL
ncbi:hypothetical protein JOM56_009366, partial [Amanita muscaria]